jgi:hypothetical protein
LGERPQLIPPEFTLPAHLGKGFSEPMRYCKI